MTPSFVRRGNPTNDSPAKEQVQKENRALLVVMTAGREIAGTKRFPSPHAPLSSLRIWRQRSGSVAQPRRAPRQAQIAEPTSTMATTIKTVVIVIIVRSG